jgi:pimeloyl-ACP methyl ester carboxylesterase
MKKVLSKDGTPIAYQQTGQGRAVILVDGAMSSRAFGPGVALAPLLAQRFTVFVYDRRGRNDSGDTPPYAVEREVEDIAALIAEAGQAVYLFGHFPGAALALRAAASGLKVEKLALYEPSYVTSGPQPPADAVAQLTRLATAGRRGDAVEYFMVQITGRPADEVARMRGSPYWPSLEAIASTLAYDAAVMGNWSVPDWLATIRIPTLVMDGASSPTPRRQTAQAVAQTLPHARYRTLEGRTHDVAPEVIAAALIEFFAGEKTREHGQAGEDQKDP